MSDFYKDAADCIAAATRIVVTAAAIVVAGFAGRFLWNLIR